MFIFINCWQRVGTLGPFDPYALITILSLIIRQTLFQSIDTFSSDALVLGTPEQNTISEFREC